MPGTLQRYLARLKDGSPAGIYSVCSAHPLVLRAAAELGADTGSLLLVEATSNQVSQIGGYNRSHGNPASAAIHASTKLRNSTGRIPV